jgi:hypothetical protein
MSGGYSSRLKKSIFSLLYKVARNTYIILLLIKFLETFSVFGA